MKALVLDGSMAVGFLLEDERFSGAIKVLQAIENGITAYVPALWWNETANALLVSERRKRSTQAGTAASLRVIQDLPIETDDESLTKTSSQSLQLAREFGLTVYDAAYLELAVRKGCALATADRQLAKAARLAGISVMGASE